MASLEEKLEALINEREAVRAKDRALTQEIIRLRADIRASAPPSAPKATGAAKAKQLAAKQRRDEVYRMRSEGMTFSAIGQAFGISTGRARDLFVIAERKAEAAERRANAARS